MTRRVTRADIAAAWAEYRRLSAAREPTQMALATCNLVEQTYRQQQLADERAECERTGLQPSITGHP